MTRVLISIILSFCFITYTSAKLHSSLQTYMHAEVFIELSIKVGKENRRQIRKGKAINRCWQRRNVTGRKGFYRGGVKKRAVHLVF